MIYKASHHPVIYPFFRLYALLKIKRNFHPILISGEYNEKKTPLLLISNHISWWDGFWAEYLNMKIFHKKFYFMMLEEQLKKHMFFNRTGGYSVRKGSKSIVESLDYTVELLNDNNNLVLMFPQGKIESVHKQTFNFEKGIGYVLKKANSSIRIIFLVNLIEYFSEPKPGLLMYYRVYDCKDLKSESMQKAFNEFYLECVAENIRKSDSQ